jgi:hypothetical protein
MTRRKRSHHAETVVLGSPGPFGKPALDASTVIPNEKPLTLSRKAKNLIAPVYLELAAASWSKKTTYQLKIDRASLSLFVTTSKDQAPSQVWTRAPEPSRHS